MDNLAPVIIFTYNRLDTLEIVIKKLQENILAKYTEIFIFSDYSKSEKDIFTVQNVRTYLKTIQGFQKVTIIEREKNYGLAKNIIEGVTDIINIYGKVIVLEDDLVTSANFLSYMNQTLDFYQNSEKIFGISGFSWNLSSLKNIEEDVFMAYRPSSWGWATWKDKWNTVDWEIKDYEIFMKNTEAKKKFNRGGMDMTRMLRHFKEGKNHSWAIRWAYFMSKNDKYCIYPKVSKIQNIGYGDNSTHCTGEHIHKTTLDDSSNTHFNLINNITFNQDVLSEFKNQNNYLYKVTKRIKIKILNIFSKDN